MRSQESAVHIRLTRNHVHVLQSVLGIILGGGAGSRLYPLTKKRAKPAVPLGANYRLIDIPVSNCINSNIRKIFVLTQFNSASLNRHLSRAYQGNMGGYKNEGFVEVLAAQQSPENPNWFQVTSGHCAYPTRCLHQNKQSTITEVCQNKLTGRVQVCSNPRVAMSKVQYLLLNSSFQSLCDPPAISLAPHSWCWTSLSSADGRQHWP